jgi:large subunit ribosomal protein L19
MRTLDFIENETLRRDIPPFRVGDAVRVHTRVREGEKERIQVFEGVVIRRHGSGIRQTFTVRKISSGVGVERVFPTESPLIEKVEIKNRGFVRRSRLYYLRELTGKKARLKSKVRDLSDLLSPEAQEQAANAAEATDEQINEPVAEVAADAAEEQGKQLTGKARKKAKAAEKVVRLAELKKEEEARAKAKAEAEAKAAKEAEAAAAAEAAEAAKAAEAGDEAGGDAAEDKAE